jgi:D-threo-aldose 1-dehydrogenase
VRTAGLPRRPDVRLTKLGFGGAPVGNLSSVVPDDVAAAALATSWDLGVRYVDTAPHYGLGLSERRIGSAYGGHPRDGWTLSTKVGRLLEPVPGGATGRDTDFHVPADRRRVWDFSRDGVLRSLESSLERLGTDRVDVVLVHDPDDHWQPASREAVPALCELRDEGVIGAVGVGMNQSAMLTRFVRETDVDVVMCAGRYSLLEQPALADLLPAAVERGVGVLAAGVFNSGLLAREEPPATATYDYQPVPDQVLRRARELADVCREHGSTLPAAAVHLVLAHPAVVSVVLGMSTPDQVTRNVALLDAAPPADLWPDLVSRGLLDPAVPAPTR